MMTGKVLNLRAVPLDLMQRAKAVAAWKGMTLKAFVIECIAQGVERAWGGMFEVREPEPAETLKEFSPSHLLLRRGINGRVLGWKCSNNCCSWAEKLPPGEMVEDVFRMFEKDAKESYAQHVANCPIQRERVSA